MNQNNSKIPVYLKLYCFVRDIISGDKTNVDVFDEFKQNKYIEDFSKRVASEEYFKQSCELLNRAYSERDTERLLQMLQNRKEKNRHNLKKRLIILSLSAAGALIAISFLIRTDIDKPAIPVVAENIKTEDFKVPTLILNNSKVIDLNDNLKTRISEDETARFDTDTITVGSRHIVVPNRHTYTVVLPDGSEVYLNACSELYFPSRFDCNERVVELKGEAYFNIAKGEVPFIVKTGKYSYVKAYGTSFNVNARDEKAVKTVLVEGVIGVGSSSIKEIKITPNHLAVVDITRDCNTVTPVDVEPYLAWKEGYLKFTDTPFSEFIEELKIWYGTDFEYDSKIFSKLKINLSVKRSGTLQEVLSFVESVIDVKFINEGRRYTIERSIR